jgi:hypothetical protein
MSPGREGSFAGRKAVFVWVRVKEWMLADDELPKPAAGSPLRSVGIRVRGVLTAPGPASADEVREVSESRIAKPSRVAYSLTGIASDIRDVRINTERRGQGHDVGTEFVLTVGAHRYQVQVDGSSADVMDGARATVTGPLELVGEYEWAAFGLTDTRADWLVTDVVEFAGGDVQVDLAPPRAE